MAKNKLTDLRNHLFETLEKLKDDENPMDLARAKAICEVSQTIINTAKVEVDMVRAVDGSRLGTTFFTLEEESRELPRKFLVEDERRPRRLNGGTH